MHRMADGAPSRPARPRPRLTRLCAAALLVTAACALSSAQVHGVPPLVTSIQFHVPPFLPNALPSVTSLGPYGNGSRAGPIPPPYGVPRSVYGRGRGSGYASYGHGGGYGGVYAVPYFVPTYDTSYSTGSDSGPYLYSGQPAEPTLHIVLDTPPPHRDYAAEEDDRYPPPIAKPAPLNEALPLAATLLVFRDGHKQEVTNYAIMGQTLYVFDQRTRKIPVNDLDLPATIKANDDRGVDFALPAPLS